MAGGGDEMGEATGLEIVVDPQKLPRRRIKKYPLRGKINSNTRTDYLLELAHLFCGTPVLKRLEESSLGHLFKLPVRKCSLGGNLVHHIIVRHLVTEKKHEMWFMIAGKPIKYSLREFWIVTRLPCHRYTGDGATRKPEDYPLGDPKYWDTLMGGHKDVKIEDIMEWLKEDREKDKPVIDEEDKFRLALIVIVEGVLGCGKQEGKVTPGIVEMVRDVDEFLRFPWGRLCFEKTLEMLQVGKGKGNKDADALIRKCLYNTHILIKGLPVAIQLIAFKAVPHLKTRILPDADDERTFTHESIKHMSMLKTFTATFMLEVEEKENLEVNPIIHTDDPMPPLEDITWADEVPDESVDYLEKLIKDGGGEVFNRSQWRGGASTAGEVPLQESSVESEKLDESDGCGGVSGGLEKKLNKLIKKLNREHMAKMKKMVKKELDRQTERIEEVVMELKDNVLKGSSGDSRRKRVKLSAGRSGHKVPSEKGDNEEEEDNEEDVSKEDGVEVNVDATESEIESVVAAIGTRSSADKSADGTPRDHEVLNGEQVEKMDRSQVGDQSSCQPVEKLSQAADVDAEGPTSSGQEASDAPMDVAVEEAGRVEPGIETVNERVEAGANGGAQGVEDGIQPTVKVAVVSKAVGKRGRTAVTTQESAAGAVVKTMKKQKVEDTRRVQFEPQAGESEQQAGESEPQAGECGRYLRFQQLLEEKKEETFQVMRGVDVNNDYFLQLVKPRQPLSINHINPIMGTIWRKNSAALLKERIFVGDANLCKLIGENYKKFNQVNAFVFPRELKLYPDGPLDDRSDIVTWVRDVDRIYVPMEWGERHWVALHIDLVKAKVDIFDPDKTVHGKEVVKKLIEPVVKMLPELVRTSCSAWLKGNVPNKFTYSRVRLTKQDKMGGETGPWACKLIELHALGDQHLDGLQDTSVVVIRKTYAMDVFSEFVYPV